jgi:hypothetical protein
LGPGCGHSPKRVAQLLFTGAAVAVGMPPAIVAMIAVLTTLAHALLTIFQHGIEFLLLISGENGADLRIGVTPHLLECKWH